MYRILYMKYHLKNVDFSILQINISSISAHFDDLTILLSSIKYVFNVIVLCELAIVRLQI